MTSRVTIIVADDDAVFRAIATRILMAAGYAVLEAENSDEALHHVQRHPGVPLLLTDLEMPEGTMDGIELAYVVKERWPAMQVIVCSARIRAQGLSLPPGVPFLAKPIPPRVLVACVRELLA